MADNDESKEGEKKTVVIKESNEDAAPPGEQDEGKAAVAAVTTENTGGPSRRMSVTPRDGKVHEDRPRPRSLQTYTVQRPICRYVLFGQCRLVNSSFPFLI